MTDLRFTTRDRASTALGSYSLASLQPELLDRRRGPAGIQRAAHQVVEGVGRLDDAAAQRRTG